MEVFCALTFKKPLTNIRQLNMTFAKIFAIPKTRKNYL